MQLVRSLITIREVRNITYPEIHFIRHDCSKCRRDCKPNPGAKVSLYVIQRILSASLIGMIVIQTDQARQTGTKSVGLGEKNREGRKHQIVVSVDTEAIDVSFRQRSLDQNRYSQCHVEAQDEHDEAPK